MSKQVYDCTITFINFEVDASEEKIKEIGLLEGKYIRGENTGSCSPHYCNQPVYESFDFKSTFISKKDGFQEKLITISIQKCDKRNKNQSKEQINITSQINNLNKPINYKVSTVIEQQIIYLHLKIVVWGENGKEQCHSNEIVQLKHVASPTILKPIISQHVQEDRKLKARSVLIPSQHTKSDSDILPLVEVTHKRNSSRVQAIKRISQRSNSQLNSPMRLSGDLANECPIEQMTNSNIQLFLDNIKSIHAFIEEEEVLKNNNEKQENGVTIYCQVIYTTLKNYLNNRCISYVSNETFLVINSLIENDLQRETTLFYLLSSMIQLNILFKYHLTIKRDLTISGLVDVIDSVVENCYTSLLKFIQTNLNKTLKELFDSNAQQSTTFLAYITFIVSQFKTNNLFSVNELLIEDINTLINIGFIEGLKQFVSSDIVMFLMSLLILTDNTQNILSKIQRPSNLTLVNEIVKVLMLQNKNELAEEDFRMNVCPHLTKEHLQIVFDCCRNTDPSQLLNTSVVIRKIDEQRVEHYDLEVFGNITKRLRIKLSDHDVSIQQTDISKTIFSSKPYLVEE